ncbi:MAG: butyrate kinase [Eubacteriales bacterium]|nr:butyrate kinase [Eubacteriales bacterium]
MKHYKIFVINPGSTSTKLSLFEDEACLFETCLIHDAPELLKFSTINQQLPLRMKDIVSFLEENHIDLTGLDAIAARGGGCCSLASGTYVIDEKLIADTRAGMGNLYHPSNLGVQMAEKIQQVYGGRMYTVNPPVVDEFDDIARISGLKGVDRKARTHVLNLKEMALRHAASLGKAYEDCRFIVCHIDGGITVSAHKDGRMIDANDAAGGGGPFTPNRTGGISSIDMVQYCKGKDPEDVLKMITGAGGLVSYFGTSDSDKVHAMVEQGDPMASLVWDALGYQICKEIGAMSTVLCGQVDGILLGGRLLRFDDLVSQIRKRCSFIAPITVYEGEFEQEALAYGALRVLRGQEAPLTYTGVPVWDGFRF